MFKTKSVPAFQKQAGTVSDLWLKNTKIESATFVIAMGRQIPGWNINTDLRPKHGTFAFPGCRVFPSYFCQTQSVQPGTSETFVFSKTTAEKCQNGLVCLFYTFIC